MSNYNKVLENVEWLLEKYNNVIDNEKKLILLYWKYIDKINVTKDTIPTQEFLSRATNPQVIGDAYYLIKIREGMSE
ncbi:hypothetical protein HPK02_00135 [Anoxybacillus flavithermus]|uniref:hypothetical protein n=1 Tax=Anoxybacillus flavithermus TaxID=33934 RepID=UPI0018675A82|nr:hypothetical protein [Anoxybacillus flavithermus]MBE2917334.1 hypothetical protein [Anoxybacillus flavithermus]